MTKFLFFECYKSGTSSMQIAGYNWPTNNFSVARQFFRILPVFSSVMSCNLPSYRKKLVIRHVLATFGGKLFFSFLIFFVK